MGWSTAGIFWIVSVDVIFKLKKLKMPLYLLAVVNGKGEGKVFATFILLSEIDNMTNIFEENNKSWE